MKETKFNIILNGIEVVKDFANKASKFDTNVYAIQGRYTVDAKSLLGLFSLDLTHPIEVEIESTYRDEVERFHLSMEEYKIENY